MSDKHPGGNPPADQEPRLTPAEQRARDAVRRLGEVRPDADFRARLRAGFVSGQLEDRPGEPATPEPFPGSDSSPVSGGRESGSGSPGEAPTNVVPGRFRRPAPAWLLLPAAAVLLLVLLPILNQGRTWQALERSPGGEVTVDGEAIGNGPGALDGLVRPGTRIRTGDASASFALSDQVAIEAAPGTDLEVMESPGRWWGRDYAFHLHAGDARILTGPGFTGKRLEITTPDALVVLAGTLVSVVSDSTGTCVCVHEGTARIGADRQDLQPVPAGSRRVFDRAAGTSKIVDIAPPHREQLIDFDRRTRDRLKPIGPR